MGFVACPPSVVSIPYVDIFAQLLHRHLHHEGGRTRDDFLSDSRGLEPEYQRLLQKHSLYAHVLLVSFRWLAKVLEPLTNIALENEPKCGGGELRSLSQWVRCAVQVTVIFITWWDSPAKRFQIIFLKMLENKFLNKLSHLLQICILLVPIKYLSMYSMTPKIFYFFF